MRSCIPGVDEPKQDVAACQYVEYPAQQTSVLPSLVVFVVVGPGQFFRNLVCSFWDSGGQHNRRDANAMPKWDAAAVWMMKEDFPICKLKTHAVCSSELPGL